MYKVTTICLNTTFSIIYDIKIRLVKSLLTLLLYGLTALLTIFIIIFTMYDNFNNQASKTIAFEHPQL